uniref:Transthyretin-like family protein n=1 Tax=Acrobeloides nanus TaxID=290746 RepID=A0A914EP52_9BILA
MLFFLSSALLFSFVTAGVRPSQAIGVRGQLLCNGLPASDVLVKLYDHDTFTLDDLIAKGKTNYDGFFEISGHEHEITRITPKLNVYHDCDDIWPCQRKFSIYIPKDYITSGKYALDFYNIGTIELAGEIDGEERDCFHKK